MAVQCPLTPRCPSTALENSKKWAFPFDIDGGSKIRPLTSGSLRKLSRKSCVQPRALPLPGATEKATDTVVLRVGVGLSFGVRLGGMGAGWVA